jgi:hypothetical protein
LWLSETKDNIYDDIVNASPVRLDETVRGYLIEIVENFDKLSDLISDHVGMCRKVNQELDKREDRDEDTDDQEESAPKPKRRSDITR